MRARRVHFIKRHLAGIVTFSLLVAPARADHCRKESGPAKTGSVAEILAEHPSGEEVIPNGDPGESSAGSGSAFRPRLSERHRFGDPVTGTEQGQIKDTLIMSRGPVSPTSALRGQDISIKPNETVTIGLTIKKRRGRTRAAIYGSAIQAAFGSPRQDEFPVARLVRFTITKPLGAFDQEIKAADQNGFVEVKFTASRKGNAKIRAEVIVADQSEDPGAGLEWKVEVRGGVSLRWKIGAAAAAGAIILWRVLRRHRKPLHKEDPPVTFPPP